MKQREVSHVIDSIFFNIVDYGQCWGIGVKNIDSEKYWDFDLDGIEKNFNDEPRNKFTVNDE